MTRTDTSCRRHGGRRLHGRLPQADFVRSFKWEFCKSRLKDSQESANGPNANTLTTPLSFCRQLHLLTARCASGIRYCRCYEDLVFQPGPARGLLESCFRRNPDNPHAVCCRVQVCACSAHHGNSSASTRLDVLAVYRMHPRQVHGRIHNADLRLGLDGDSLRLGRNDLLFLYRHED